MRVFRVTCVAMLAITAGIAWGQDGDKEKAQEIRSSLSKDGKTTACLGACSINFQKELGVPFGYLIPIGSQIHQARTNNDPVTIALAARGLAVAESVSGKKAKVTAAAVMAEAVELAKLRGDVKELRAMAQLVSDQTHRSQLSELAEVASKVKPKEEGEASREQYGKLTVDNHTAHTLRIVVDGRFLGVVPMGQTRVFRVHSHRERTHYDAYCVEDGELIRHALGKRGHWHDLRWHIDE